MFAFLWSVPAALQQKKLNSGSKTNLQRQQDRQCLCCKAQSPALVVSPCVGTPHWLVRCCTFQPLKIGCLAERLVRNGAWYGRTTYRYRSSGGRLLLSGAWMVSVKQVFGVLLLAVAIVVLLSRFVAIVHYDLMGALYSPSRFWCTFRCFRSRTTGVGRVLA
ncbi:hypothetical protein O9929_14930 [Vibrio lentus]|nr:hypothetical protein [Vibrio lentus]